jgi:uncharacterized phage protein (TIGR02218 family)
MRGLTQNFRTTASGDHNRPLELIDIYLDTATYYFVVNNTEEVTFFNAISGDSVTYRAIPGAREPAHTSMGFDIDRIRLGIANVDKVIIDALQAHEFRGRRVVVRQIFEDVKDSSGDAVTIFDGLMDSPTVDPEWVSVNAVPRIGSLQRKAPGIWYQLPCNWKFGSEECGVNAAGAAYSKAKVCDAGCTASQILGVDIDEEAKYWRRGYVRFTSGQNMGLRQTIKTSTQGSIDLDNPLLYPPAEGDTYIVRSGCDKTLYMCSGDYANEDNFGGFHTIPENMIIK